MESCCKYLYMFPFLWGKHLKLKVWVIWSLDVWVVFLFVDLFVWDRDLLYTQADLALPASASWALGLQEILPTWFSFWNNWQTNFQNGYAFCCSHDQFSFLCIFDIICVVPSFNFSHSDGCSSISVCFNGCFLNAMTLTFILLMVTVSSCLHASIFHLSILTREVILCVTTQSLWKAEGPTLHRRKLCSD